VGGWHRDGHGDRRAEPGHQEHRSRRSGAGSVEHRPLAGGQDGERADGDGQGQHAVHGIEHLPAVVQQDDGAGRAASVGQDQGHYGGQVIEHELDDPDDRQAGGPACHAWREPQRGPERQVQPPGGRHGHEDQRGDAQRGAARQDKLGRQRERGQRQPFAQGREGEVGGDDHEAGDGRPQGRPGEPAVRLQQSVEHDRKPGQDDLRGEHHEHAAGGGDYVGPDAVRVGIGGIEQARDRTRGGRDGQGQRHQDDDGPGEQRRGDLADPGPLLRVGIRAFRGASQHRDHRARQRAAQDQLVDQVGDLIRGDVGRSQAGRADTLREHQRAGESEQPGQDRETGDHRGAASDARGGAPRQIRVHLRHVTMTRGRAGGSTGPAGMVRRARP